MSRSTLFAALAVIASLACARTQTAQAKQTTAVAASKQGAVATNDRTQGKIVCTYENPVGSHIPEKVCFYQEDVDSTRQETQELLRQNAARQVLRSQ